MGEHPYDPSSHIPVGHATSAVQVCACQLPHSLIDLKGKQDQTCM